MKVLILINKVGLGDCIIHINYIHEISKKYGKPVSILAKENTRAKDLFLDDPHISEVITLDRLNDNTGYHDGINGFFNAFTKECYHKFEKMGNLYSTEKKYMINGQESEMQVRLGKRGLKSFIVESCMVNHFKIRGWLQLK